MARQSKKVRPAQGKGGRLKSSAGAGGQQAQKRFSRAPLVAALVVGALLASGLVVYLMVCPALEPVVPRSDRSIDAPFQKLIDEHVARVRAAPRDPASHAMLGLVYEANHLWDESVASYTNCLALGSNDPVWRYHRAIALRAAGQSEDALAELQAMVADHETFGAMRYRLGLWLLESGDPAAAEKHFRVVTVLQPDAPEGWVGLGTCRLRRDDPKGAVSLLERALRMDPAYKACLYTLGLAYRSLGRRDEATALMARGRDGQPRLLRDGRTADVERLDVSIAGIIDRALLLIAAGASERAAVLLEQALRARPNEPSLLVSLASAYREMGRQERAIALLERIVESDPTYFAAYINLALYSLDLGRQDEALRYADLAVEHGPTMGQAHLTRARVLTRMGRIEESLESLERTAALDVRDAEVFVALGETYARLQRFEEAKVSYVRALKKLPGELSLLLKVSAICIQSGDRDGAADALRTARRVAPGDARVARLTERLASLPGG